MYLIHTHEYKVQVWYQIEYRLQFCRVHASEVAAYSKQACIIFIQVLQRKTEEAAMATKRLKELLEARKTSSRDTFGMICFMWQ